VISLCRVQQLPEALPGRWLLVDRLWPRGFSRERLQVLQWVPGLAPSHALRRAFHQDDDFAAFRLAYRRELAAQPGLWWGLLDSAERGELTLCSAVRDLPRSHVGVLADWLDEALERRGPPSSSVCYSGLPPE